MLKTKLIFRGKNISYNFINNIGMAITICFSMALCNNYPNLTLENCSSNIIAFILMIPIICVIRYFVYGNILFSTNKKEDATMFDLLYWTLGAIILSMLIIVISLKELSL